MAPSSSGLHHLPSLQPHVLPPDQPDNPCSGTAVPWALLMSPVLDEQQSVCPGVSGQCRLCCDFPLPFLPPPGSNTRARRGRVTGATSTKRTSAAKRRRRPVRTVPRRERSRTPRSDPQPAGGTSLNQRGAGDVLGWGFILYSMFPKGRGRLWVRGAAAAAGESCSSTLFSLVCFFDTRHNPAVPVYRALSYS